MVRDDGSRALVRLIDQLPNFLIDLEGNFVAVIALLADFAAKEDELVLLAKRQRAERFDSCRTQSPSAGRSWLRARCRLTAPVDCSSKTIDSATCPAMNTASSSSN